MVDKFRRWMIALVITCTTWVISEYFWINWLVYYVTKKINASLEFRFWSINTILNSYKVLLAAKYIDYFDYFDYIFIGSIAMPLFVLYTLIIIIKVNYKIVPDKKSKSKFIRGARWATVKDLKEKRLL